MMILIINFLDLIFQTYAILINNLFDVIQPADSELIKLQCQYVTQLIKDGIFLDSQLFKFTIIKCYKWIVNNMQHSESLVTKELLTCLKYVINPVPNKIALDVSNFCLFFKVI